MTYVLAAAGVYNIVWAVQAIFWPNWLFHWAGMAAPAYPEIWQGLGLFLGVWGIGYLVAATNPLRHWPIVLVGLLSRIFDTAGLLKIAADHRLPPKLGWILIASDVIWWIPLGTILWYAHETRQGSKRHAFPEVQELALRVRTNKGRSLLDMSVEKPLLLVFLRTTDCPFCREALTHIAEARRNIQQKDMELVLVHMGEDQAAHEFLHSYTLSDVPRVSDPQLHLYRAFGLRRTTIWKVMGPPMWLRGTVRLIRYGAGKLTPDLLQMPGVFVVFHGQVLWNFRHQSIADQPRYQDIPVPF